MKAVKGAGWQEEAEHEGSWTLIQMRRQNWFGILNNKTRFGTLVWRKTSCVLAEEKDPDKPSFEVVHDTGSHLRNPVWMWAINLSNKRLYGWGCCCCYYYCKYINSLCWRHNRYMPRWWPKQQWVDWFVGIYNKVKKINRSLADYTHHFCHPFPNPTSYSMVVMIIEETYVPFFTKKGIISTLENQKKKNLHCIRAFSPHM